MINEIAILNQDKYEQYDRNIRLWGKDNQEKLMTSQVLLINLNCAVTEVAKNLILAGINVILYDRDLNGNKLLVTIEDVQSNFFLNPYDINKERGLILKEKLERINSFVSVGLLDNLDSVRPNCVCVGCLNKENKVK